VLTIDELKHLSASLKPAEFRKQLGPFALVQRPPEPEADPGKTAEDDNPWGSESTSVARPGAMAQGTLSMVFQFDDLLVATIPPLEGVDELTVGRQPDCDLVIEHPSVSKRHAVLRWDEKARRATIQDTGSRNGTFVNAGDKLTAERPLKDGDIISFGEVQYWYWLIETLHGRLAQSARIASHRGV
jgi:hypothetical protein